jgi:predicted CoA-binding protein
MTAAKEILEESGSVLVVDWPSQDVPDTLVRAGFSVTVKGGPGAASYTAHELAGDQVVTHPTEIPAHIDLLYVHRPAEELAGLVMIARSLGTKAVWYQSGRAEGGASDPKGCWLPQAESSQARQTVESAELAYIDDVYIADAVRQFAIQK